MAAEREGPGRAGMAGAAVLAIGAALAYGALRWIHFRWPGWGADGVASAGLLLAETFVVFQSIAFAVNFLYSSRNPRPPADPLADPAPGVAVLVPARHEPFEVLDRTFSCLKGLDYPALRLVLLDDSSEERYQREAERLAVQHGIRLFRRAERHGAKAGIVNDCVRTLDEPYVAILDCDQNPRPGFLREVVPILEADPRLAFVQTPQFYTNGEASPVAAAANLQHCIFYEYICEGKSARNAMIMCGTNVVLRRRALLDVGGLDEGSITEDFATTIEWHRRGWRSYFYNRACAFGAGPETLGAYLKQQYRWARGNLGVLRNLAALFIRDPGALTPGQWWEHLVTGSYYLMGLATLVLLLSPVLYLLFGVTSFSMPAELYACSFAPYFALSILLFFGSMKLRHYSAGQLFAAMVLGTATFPVYVRAAWDALWNRRARFSVTEKGGGTALPLSALRPQAAFWLLDLAALTWGANALAVDWDGSLAVSLVWAAFHFALLSSVFYFRLSAGVPVAPPRLAGGPG